MKYDFYLFDLDGTLLDLGNIRTHIDQILIKTLKKLNVDEIPNTIKRNELWLSGGQFQNVLNKWGINDSVNFWKLYDKTDFKRRLVLLKNKKIKLFQGVESTLKLIYHHKENKKLAICTNTANYIVNYFLKYFKIFHYFHEIFSMGDGNEDLAKPSPKGILTILNKLEFDPQINSAIMIGDSFHDIKAAKKAKIFSCLINHNKSNEFNWYKEWEIQPDYVVRNLKEIIDL